MREFGHIWIKPLEIVRDSVSELAALAPSANGMMRVSDLSEFVRDEKTSRGSARLKDKVWAICDSLRDRYGNEHVRADELALWLDDEINDYLSYRLFSYPSARQVTNAGGYSYTFEKMASEADGTLLDDVNCGVALRQPDKRSVTFQGYSCNGRYRECSVKDVLRRATTHVGPNIQQRWHAEIQVRNAWRKLQPKMTAQTNQAIGMRLCFPLGDIAIAMECPGDTTIVTKDKQQAQFASHCGISVLLV